MSFWKERIVTHSYTLHSYTFLLSSISWHGIMCTLGWNNFWRSILTFDQENYFSSARKTTKYHWNLTKKESKSNCISRKSCLMPCLKTILNCFALEQSTFKTKHGIRLNFSSGNPVSFCYGRLLRHSLCKWGSAGSAGSVFKI